MIEWKFLFVWIVSALRASGSHCHLIERVRQHDKTFVCVSESKYFQSILINRIWFENSSENFDEDLPGINFLVSFCQRVDDNAGTLASVSSAHSIMQIYSGVHQFIKVI